MNTKSTLDTHDERQSAYRGNGPDASVDGRGRDDPSAVQTHDAQPPRDGAPEALNQRGHGRGGSLGEGEPDGHPERDGSTQPNFGQSGTYGKQRHIDAQQRALDDGAEDTGND
ncbi:hypothetical protein [Xanthomonas phaseoli]|uniref:hypothetical protein n=1 Tax=Xanthomonas phaseoli TaxID=1985254 RepID=UPI001237BA20|nr:hypothetical protein [Xanthomonas phaseoli]MBO9831930.1 hypothetical protein [Xanthomonas phaseoli pv. dieffenbachiae]MBO9835669.1 hypothetical protein [Xanthomonas phaseoli pv. dieffenbachiae]MBO9840549.1 hypothetical protein [Xanthomonas phaseoli pv. dieffenbachiae]MBO9859556.1 hypothetical protein [Xanthomonas phaseoli pv. dieffenbachiae]MBO9865518.1 hypothetical protein [Xanthomonas phaseoli pv. dieffenbachiae]